jgi:prostaglandin-H2 D-isomerase / glutathione transferase
MPKYTLTYFDNPASRGEECRLALHAAGLPFTDERLKREEWPARKPSAPFGALPVLTVDGRQLAQSNAILRFIGSQHGLHPAEPFEAAVHESILCAVEEMRTKMGPIMRIKDEGEKKKARQEAAAGFLPEWAGQIERLLGAGPFAAGAKLCVVDLKLFVAIGAYQKGTIDYIPTDVFNPFPKLTRLVEAVRQHPRVVDWYARKK